MKFLFYGITIPKKYDNSNWSLDFRNWIDNLEFDYPTGKGSLESKMRSL
ncbi:hypothetical protein ACFQ0R_05780 [Psychroflexus salinarum]|uniref:Uncharacterized protein n=1 Tax=Psychroflexus salinarum TaxID=546024 RepID=A0ABW3GNB8_9FLAO